MDRSAARRWTLFVMAAVVSGGVPALAATKTWDGDAPISGSTWYTSVLGIFNGWNWGGDNGNPVANDDLVFAGTTRLANNNNYAEGTAFNSIAFNNTAGAFVLSGNSVTLGAGGVVNNDADTQILYLPLILNATHTFHAASGDLVLGGTISGAGGLQKSGASHVTLLGANTYAGTTTIQAGTLRVGNGGTTGSLGRGNVVNNGVLEVNRSNDITVGNTISGTGALVKRGAGTTILTGANTYSGGTTIYSGTLFLQAGGRTGSGAVTINAAGTLSGAGTIAANASITGTHAPGGGAAGLLAFSADLSYEEGAQILWDFFANSDAGAGSSRDAIDVGGNLSFNGATELRFAFSGPGSLVDWTDAFWNSNQSTKLIGVEGRLFNLDRLSLVAEDWTDAFGNTFRTARADAAFSLRAAGSGDVYLDYAAESVIPEPAVASFILLFGGALLAGKRIFG